MEQFCRTCGKTINGSCINIFLRDNSHLLRCVRVTTNCWLENMPGLPLYMCRNCQKFLKEVHAFRKRCARIQNSLTKHRTRLGVQHTALVPADGIADPLQIELQNPIKKETAHDAYEEPLQCSEDEALDDEMPEPAIKNNRVVLQTGPVKAPSKKHTMRLGRKLVHVKITNEKHPKRIVDRDRRPWAAAQPCICELCGRQFKDMSNLNVHLLRHKGTKNFECQECHQKCYTLHLLRRHQLKHTEGPYLCNFCGVEYSTNSSRVRHERESCKKGRAPKSKTELIKRGERTFHCDVCDLWFLRAGNLTQHMNSSHHIANERRKKHRSGCKQK